MDMSVHSKDDEYMSPQTSWMCQWYSSWNGNSALLVLNSVLTYNYATLTFFISKWLLKPFFKQLIFDDPKLLKAFAKLMMKVKTKAVVTSLIINQDRGDILYSELSTAYTAIDTLQINNLQANLFMNPT